MLTYDLTQPVKTGRPHIGKCSINLKLSTLTFELSPRGTPFRKKITNIDVFWFRPVRDSEIPWVALTGLGYGYCRRWVKAENQAGLSRQNGWGN